MTLASGNFLSLDTALGETGIAVWKESGVVARFHAAQREDQAALLLPRIEAALAQAGLVYRALDGIAVCVGPGGFTSIRVGLAAARGIGFAAGIKVHGYSSLHLMAYGSGEEEIVAVLPAGRDRLFVQRFAPGTEALPPEMIMRGEVKEAGAVVTTLRDIEAGRVLMHDVSRNAVLLAEMLAHGVPPLSPAPLYVRPADAAPQASLLERLGEPRQL